MSLLDTLRQQESLFLPAIPQKPQGRYVHFLLLRETESFPLFQTDGSLNVIRVRAGRKPEHKETFSRLVLFKRKQTSPERLMGRELLRFHGIITDAEKQPNTCIYNSAEFCKQCPDCILYGYAIGSSGAEKSKVYVDSSFSITKYDTSHKAFSFNALYEHGTMTEGGVTRASFGEQDHIVPQVFFPSIVTLRDPTYAGFLYVLGNILRTDHYGAQETRTGKVHNHLIGIVWANGEIFSNLRFTQVVYDELVERGQYREHEPLDPQDVQSAALSAYKTLIGDEPISRAAEFLAPEVEELRREMTALYSDAGQTRALIEELSQTAREYAERYALFRHARDGATFRNGALYS
jgi:CRISPR-associated protein Csc2